MYKVAPTSSWSQTLSLPSNWPLYPSFPSCWHPDIQAPEFPGPISNPACALTPKKYRGALKATAGP